MPNFGARRPAGLARRRDSARLGLHQRGGRVADDVHAGLRGALGAVRIDHAVPERRVRLLQRLELHRHVLVAEELPSKFTASCVSPCRIMSSASAYICGVLGVDAVIAELDRRDAAADAELEPAAAHLVEHADLFGQPQRMIERKHIDQRPEAQPLGALRDRGERTRSATAPCRAASNGARRSDSRRSRRGRRPRSASAAPRRTRSAAGRCGRDDRKSRTPAALLGTPSRIVALRRL